MCARAWFDMEPLDSPLKERIPMRFAAAYVEQDLRTLSVVLGNTCTELSRVEPRQMMHLTGC